MVWLHLRFPASIVPEISSVAENPVSVVHASRDDLSSVYQSFLQPCISPHVTDDSSDSSSRYLRSFGKVTKDAGRLTRGLVGAVRDNFQSCTMELCNKHGIYGLRLADIKTMKRFMDHSCTNEPSMRILSQESTDSRVKLIVCGSGCSLS